jgi:enterochelin esterase-like enzyme
MMANPILHRLKIEPTPFIDDSRVTFVWKGRIPPLLVGDFTGWDEEHPITMKKVGPSLWIYQHEFLPDAYVEYSFLQDEDSVLDPFNHRQSPNGIGGYNNFFSMPGYRASKLYKKKRKIPHGMVKHYDLPTDYLIPGKKRTIHLYQPPVDRPVPLVVVWDGQDYLKWVHLHHMMDNLIHQGRIQPVALAFIDNAGQDLRTMEYSCNDATLGFLIMQVIPFTQRELNLIDIKTDPGAYGILGASMGGLMALYTGIRLSQMFGRVLSQSGAFSLGDFDMVVYDLVQQSEKRPVHVWLNAGVYDLYGLLETNQRMHQVLKKKGYSVMYREYHAGHNYPAWRDEIWRGFEALYGAGNPGK